MDLEFDRQHIWHPYTSMIEPTPVFPVEKTLGCEIHLQTGEKLIDGMSSWWSAIHGYQHPNIVSAIQSQAQTMPHVMFGGLTHEPAITLAKKLVAMTPTELQRVFIADSGSVSAEVSLKMAIQYQEAKGNPDRVKFLTVRNGYHGDTFGAMSVCDPDGGMHSLYKSSLPQHFFAPAPQTAFDDEWDPNDTNAIEKCLKDNIKEIAAIIIEPVVQGAGGMRIYHPNYLKTLRELCDETGTLLIFDEIATGFGRTGKLFALEWPDVVPDVLCVGKALTGGTMSLAATLTTDHVALTISKDGSGVLNHGPTFMGNPLACAAANASLELLTQNDWQQQTSTIEQYLKKALLPLKQHERVADVRVLGAIGVVELTQAVDMQKIQPLWIQHGVWIRPFGKLVYIMPPYVITQEQLAQLCQAITRVTTEGDIF